MASASLASCIFCKIIKGEIPSMKLLETETVFAFMDIGPIAKGHCLVIPKYHAAKLTDLPEKEMNDILPVCKKLAKATGAENFNLLQVRISDVALRLNNGRPAHQVVDHVHFHIIPKDADGGDKQGLVIGWPTQKDLGKEELTEIFEDMKSRL